MDNQKIPEIFTNDAVARYCDVLEKLRSGFYENFSRRQTYEWKMCVTIWTPLVAFLGILLTRPHVWFPWTPLVSVLALLAAIHVLWQRNLQKANKIDIEKMRDYEDRMSELCEMKKPYDRKGFLVFRNWSHILYVVITVGLISSVCYINYSKRSNISVLPDDVRKTLDLKYGTDLEARDTWIGNALRTKLALPSAKATAPQIGDAAAEAPQTAGDRSADSPFSQIPNPQTQMNRRKPSTSDGR